jgi:hypothetical protein
MEAVTKPLIATKGRITAKELAKHIGKPLLDGSTITISVIVDVQVGVRARYTKKGYFVDHESIENIHLGKFRGKRGDITSCITTFHLKDLQVIVEPGPAKLKEWRNAGAKVAEATIKGPDEPHIPSDWEKACPYKRGSVEFAAWVTGYFDIYRRRGQEWRKANPEPDYCASCGDVLDEDDWCTRCE